MDIIISPWPGPPLWRSTEYFPCSIVLNSFLSLVFLNCWIARFLLRVVRQLLRQAKKTRRRLRCHVEPWHDRVTSRIRALPRRLLSLSLDDFSNSFRERLFFFSGVTHLFLINPALSVRGFYFSSTKGKKKEKKNHWRATGVGAARKAANRAAVCHYDSFDVCKKCLWNVVLWFQKLRPCSSTATESGVVFTFPWRPMIEIEIDCQATWWNELKRTEKGNAEWNNTKLVFLLFLRVGISLGCRGRRRRNIFFFFFSLSPSISLPPDSRGFFSYTHTHTHTGNPQGVCKRERER